MQGLQKTCLILAVLTLSIQSVRHFYVKFFENKVSVLDKYEKGDIKEEIERADTLDELVAKYDPAKKREDELDAIQEKAERGKPEEEREASQNAFRGEHKQDYERAAKLRSAIQDWESKAREIRELRIFWTFGFGLLLLGCILYFKSPWLGMAFLIPGIAEMIWWTTPTFRFAGTVKEFERLLNNKLVFTNITLVLVILVWFLSGRIHVKKKEERTL